jgi:pimeloyl-ACP methyl ester carboxylesterase
MKARVAGLVVISVALGLASSPLAVAAAASVHARFDLGSLLGSPFPSNRFTVADSTENTALKVNLPKPDCGERPSDCSDIDVLNELDGFNLQPRLSIPFDGPIDVGSVTSQSVFLVSLGSTLPGGDTGGEVVGIDQVVRDTFTNTLHVESDQQLAQHTRYVLVVTRSLLDESGKHVKAAEEFLDLLNNVDGASTGDPAVDAYRTSLRDALLLIDEAGLVPLDQVVAASVFTTQSVTAILEKIRDQIKAATPEPADFLLGSGGSRTVFDRSTVAKIEFNRQTSADPALPLSPPQQLPLSVLDTVPGAVGTIAFGRYSSPDYRDSGEFIPPVATLSGTPIIQGTDNITFILFLPSRSQPAGGYPVAIYAHGTGGNKVSSGFVAAKLADQGIATIAIDAPGYGFGPISTYKVTRTDSSSVTFLAGGRSIDQSGNGLIGNGEGFDAAPPRMLLDGRDGFRQETVDLMQLVREVEVGVDVDGDGGRDLDPSRINLVGVSRGGQQGAIFLALEPSLEAGVLTSSGSGSAEYARLAAGRGDFLGVSLQSRVPSLINSSGITSIDGISLTAPYFNESLPLSSGASLRVVPQGGSTEEIRSPVVNTVAGAVEIQQVLDNAEWATQSASAVAYAPYIRRSPLPGVPPKSVIIQFANGDRLVPNPGVTAMLRAGDLADRATFVRTNDLFSVNPIPFPGDRNLYPHDFMSNAVISAIPSVKAIALKAQQQIAIFFASDGTLVTDPDDVPPALSVPIFEVPIVPPLPEATNYFP